MKNEEIIALAREARGATGWLTEQHRNDPELADTDVVFGLKELEHFAKLVAEREREECAQIVDEFVTIEGIAQHCAAAIRARSEK